MAKKLYKTEIKGGIDVHNTPKVVKNNINFKNSIR